MPSMTVSLVIPAHDEEDVLETAVHTVRDHLGGFLDTGSFEILVVEDGCTDRTPAIARRLAAEYGDVSHLHFPDRMGRGAALEAAFGDAQGDIFAYLDADLSTDPVYLEPLLTAVRDDGFDIATGSRRISGADTERAFSRRIASWGFNGLARLLLGSTVHDHQCGFKAFDRDALGALLPVVERRHWFWDTELLVRAQHAGYTVAEIPVAWVADDDSSVRLVRDTLVMGYNLLALSWELHTGRSAAPAGESHPRTV